MIIAESIGFAATHSITEILGDLPGYEVSHGSQDFATKAPIGQGAQTPEDFVAAMAASRQNGQTPVAVHTLFPPQALKPACEAAGGQYWLLVRDPEAQIESCHAWIKTSILSGNAPHFAQVLKQSLHDLAQAQIPANLSNCLYSFACHHVLSYNFIALGLGAPFRKMEDLMSDEAAFRQAFDVPSDTPLPHFDGDKVHSASHRAKSQADMAEPDRAQIQERYALTLGERAYTLADMRHLLGY